jgi:cation transport protein ChaC
MTGSDDRWVFGYGSLMWRPGFPFVEKQAATLHGKKRAFCIYSVYHRGDPGRPGLVLGLTSGSFVQGVAFRVAAADWDETYAYLLEREQPSETYVEASAEVELGDGDRVESLVFFSDVLHPQWAGMLDLDEQARLIAGASGLSGRNIDYLRDLVAHLRVEGVPDPAMERLLEKAEALDPCAGVRTAA